MSDEFPILRTTHGAVKGRKNHTIYGEEYYSFEGIPYAKPPLGELRFKAPQPAEPWEHILECLKCAEKPLQQNMFSGEYEGAEDCLYLNVYAKQLHSEKPLPVLVYIYGGSFQNGEATRELLGADYFMQEQVLLVTLNYRLGPLGFLCLNDASLSVPGNAGLKDQLAALRWFKKNCQVFNGDTQNITLFGNSAGSASVHYLMLTELTRGLFHKAVLMSGTVCNKWSLVPMADYAYRLAQRQGYKGINEDKLVLEFLKHTDGKNIVGLDIRTEEERCNDIAFVFGPIVESYIDVDCIISKPAQEALKTTWTNEIPVMIGGTSFEGLLRYPRVKADKSLLKVLKYAPELIVPWEVRITKPLEECQKLGRDILQLYFDGADFTFENVFKYLNLISHKIFWHGFHRSVCSRLTHAKAPTYMYRFDFDSPSFNFYRLKYCGPKIRGVAHADDLSYLFYNKLAWRLDKESEEYQTIRRMVGMWTSFASTSNPNCAQIEPAIWQPVELTQPYNCLNIGKEVVMMELPEAKKLQFWKSLYIK